jgi:hypothetical protein
MRKPGLDARARDWQQALALRLAELPYTRLCELPERREIDPPPELEGLRFAVERHGPRNGRLRIEVFEIAEATERPTSVDSIVRTLEARRAVWFEKRADDSVSWPIERE